MKQLAASLFLLFIHQFCLLVPVQAQQSNSRVVDMLRFARIQAIAERQLQSIGYRMPVLPPSHIESAADTIRPWLDRMAARLNPVPEPEPVVVFGIDNWIVVPRLEIPVYKDQFANVDWAFLGANQRTPIDTLITVDLRARLQYHYGDPTRTMVEVGYPDTLASEEVIQFEYWFILNDSIPVLLMDVNGPRDRGVVFASAGEHRRILPELKNALLGQLIATEARKSYADFYYSMNERTWYVAGYNGARLFIMRIDRPNLILGRPGIERYFPSEDTIPDKLQ